MKLLFLVPAAAAMKAAWDLPLLAPEGKQPLTLSRLQMPANPQPMADLKVTEHVVQLTRRNIRSKSSHYIQAIQEQAMAARGESRLAVRSVHPPYIWLE